MERTNQLALPATRSWRNPALGLAIDLLTALADVCLQPLVIVPLFIVALTDSLVVAGVAVALMLAAREFAHPLAVGLERYTLLRLGGLIGALGLRALALFILASAGLVLAGQGGPYRTVALLLLTASGLLAGVAATIRREPASSSPATARLAGDRARRLLVGNAAAILAALAARGLLARADLRLTGSYTHLFLLGGLLLTGATLAAVLLQPVAREASRRDPRAHLATLVSLLMDNFAYNRLLVFRTLYQLGALADPFYILYATRELGGDGRAIGGYLLALVVAQAATGFVWRLLGLQGGQRIVLQLAAFIRLLAPIAALTLPPLLGSATLRERLPGGATTSLTAFGLLFVALGAARAASDLALPALETAITTPRERPVATIVSHLVAGVAAAAIVVGGLIADRLGFPFLFLAALGAGLAALLLSGLMEEPNLVILRSPPPDHPEPRRRH